MDYKHILAAIDLSSSSEKVIEKAVSLAKSTDAQLSFIFVDTGDVSNVGIAHPEIDYVIPIEERKKELEEQLLELAYQANYPVENSVVVMGDFNTKVTEKVKEMGIDLLICGHHHDFWSRFFSVSHKLVNSLVIDMLFIHLDK